MCIRDRAWLLVSRGATSSDSAAGAIFGVTSGAGICLIYLILDHIGRRRREIGRLDDQPEAHGTILRRLLVIAVPITICASVTPITLSLIHIFSGVVRAPHVIDQEKCIKCGTCMDNCRFDAISKH